MSVRPELSSMSTALDELAARIAGLAEEAGSSAGEDVSLALLEVERSLRAAQRRLARVVADLET